MNTKLIATAVALAATMFAAPANANLSDSVEVGEVGDIIIVSIGPDKCRSVDNHYPGGSWSTDCSGVDSNGCVGTWGSSGTHDLNKKHETTYSYSDVTCPLLLFETNSIVGIDHAVQFA